MKPFIQNLRGDLVLMDFYVFIPLWRAHRKLAKILNFSAIGKLAICKAKKEVKNTHDMVDRY